MSENASIKARLTQYLDSVNWHYTVDEERDVIRSKVRLKGKLNQCELVIRMLDKCFIVYATVNLRADASCRAKICDYLQRANFGLRWGNFELDMGDGEIRYKVLVDCGDDLDCLPTDSLIRRAIFFPASMLDKYGDGILSVMYDMETPEEAATRIKNQSQS